MSTSSRDDRFAPLVASLTGTAQLVKRIVTRLDALSLDLARDAGAVSRDAQALASHAQHVARHAATRGDEAWRATPRAFAIGRAAAALIARHRWLRLVAAARGHTDLTEIELQDLARRTTDAVAELRGGIAKLGQLASCRPDLLGATFARELASLQDDVPAVHAASIRARIETELSRPIDALFATFDDVPLAAASLAQVHAATLHDGTRVVVKVQIPQIEHVIEADIATLGVVATALGDVPGVDLPTLARELARALRHELDYLSEAEALRRFVSPRVQTPRPIASHSTGRVLTMTRIDGTNLADALDRISPDGRDRVLGELVTELAAQIFERGCVHADPHPGNVLVTPTGQLALIDFGCTLELTPDERRAYARLVLAIAAVRDQAGDEAVMTQLAAIGFTADDPAKLVEATRSLLGALRPGANIADLDWSAEIAMQLAQARQLSGLEIPRSFVLLGRVLATLAGMLSTYRPRVELAPLILRPVLAAACEP